METLRNVRNLAALNQENCDENPTGNLPQNTSVAKSQDDYKTQVSEAVGSRITKKMSKDFSRTEGRNLGSLSRLDEFLLNPLLQGHSGSAPESCRNAPNINQVTNEDDSKVDSHPETRVSQSQTTHVWPTRLLRQFTLKEKIRTFEYKSDLSYDAMLFWH